MQAPAGPRLTNVADMPGYPTRKLLFGGPETRTNAAMVIAKPQRQLQAKRNYVEGLGSRGAVMNENGRR